MDIAKASTIKDRIFTLAPETLEKYPILFAYLYGSYVIEQIHPFSDLDIAVYTTPLSIRGKLDLEMALSLKIDQILHSEISSDIRIMNDMPLTIAGKIITDGVLIFSKDEKARVDYETKVRCAYFDFLPFLTKYQRNFIKNLIV